jgi:hypothetical protein
MSQDIEFLVNFTGEDETADESRGGGRVTLRFFMITRRGLETLKLLELEYYHLLSYETEKASKFRRLELYQ